MGCPACGESGCEQCTQGRIEIAACPLTVITEDIWEMIWLADLYKKGLPPMDGGAMDQTAVFVRAARFYWNTEAEFKAKKGILNDG